MAFDIPPVAIHTFVALRTSAHVAMLMAHRWLVAFYVTKNNFRYKLIDAKDLHLKSSRMLNFRLLFRQLSA